MNACEEMLHIMNVIWSSRSKEQLDACDNMIKTFEKKHGSDNIGITLLSIEMTRQNRLNQLFAKMGKVQQTLKETKGQQKEIKEGKK